MYIFFENRNTFLLFFFSWNISEKIIFCFFNDLVPSPVQHLEITKVTNTSIEFRWKRPHFPNGDITHYNVIYETDIEKIFNTTTNLALKLEKLHPYKMYTINVSACTREGCSNSSSVKNRTLIGSKYTFFIILNIKISLSILISFLILRYLWHNKKNIFN